MLANTLGGCQLPFMPRKRARMVAVSYPQGWLSATHIYLLTDILLQDSKTPSTFPPFLPFPPFSTPPRVPLPYGELTPGL